MVNIDNLLESKKVKAGIFILLGIILINSDQSKVLTPEVVGWGIIVISGLWLLGNFMDGRDVKKSLKSNQIKIPEDKFIAEYFEKNNHRYVYQPKDCKNIAEFYVTDFDVYVKYWNSQMNEHDKKIIDKKAKKQDIYLIKIPQYCIGDFMKLHGSFSNQLAKIAKRR